MKPARTPPNYSRPVQVIESDDFQGRGVVVQAVCEVAGQGPDGKPYQIFRAHRLVGWSDTNFQSRIRRARQQVVMELAGMLRRALESERGS